MTTDRPSPTDPFPAAGKVEAIGPGSVCLGCTYDLTGLMPHGPCPECGTPIVDSLSGNLLAFADTKWLSRTHRGLRRVTRSVLFPLLFAGLSMIAAMVVLSLTANTSTTPAHVNLVDTSLAVLLWINVAVLGCAPFVGLHGWFIATTAEPNRQDERTNRVRQLARWSAVVWFLLTIALIAGIGTKSIVVPGAGTYVFWMSWSVHVAGSAFHYWSAMSYVRVLANRVPAPKLTRQAGAARVGLAAATTIGMLACGLGPIGAFIYYLAVIDTAHNALKPIVRRRCHG